MSFLLWPEPAICREARARVKAKTATSLGAQDHSLGWSPALLLAEDEVAVGRESRGRGHSGDTEQTLVRKREWSAMQQPHQWQSQDPALRAGGSSALQE